MDKSVFDTEAFDYVQLAFEKYHDHQMHGCIKLREHIDEKIFKSAVIESLVDLPQLKCRLCGDKWEEVSDAVMQEHIKVINAEISKENIDNILIEKNSLENGPQLTVTVIKGEKSDAIVVVMNHMLCDGMAFKAYIYLLCDLYNQFSCGVNKAKRYYGKNRSIGWIAKRKLRTGYTEKQKKSVDSLNIVGDKNSPSFIVEKIDKQNFSLIRQYSKKHNVTLNEIFLTAYYFAALDTFKRELTTICCAVDLRRYINNKEEIGLCNQTGNIFCNVSDCKSKKFEEVLKEVHSIMTIEKQNENCLKSVKMLNSFFSVLPKRLASWIIKKVISNPPIAFTNLGIIDESRLNFNGIETEDCFITGSMKVAPNFQVAVSTFQGEVTVGVNMCVSNEEKVLMQKFLTSFCKTLCNHVKSNSSLI